MVFRPLWAIPTASTSGSPAFTLTGAATPYSTWRVPATTHA